MKLKTTADLLDAMVERYGVESDRQVAEKLEIPQATISSWRRGRSFPTEVHAVVIGRALGIPPALVLVIAAIDRAPARDRAAWRADRAHITAAPWGRRPPALRVS